MTRPVGILFSPLQLGEIIQVGFLTDVLASNSQPICGWVDTHPKKNKHTFKAAVVGVPHMRFGR